MKFDHAGEVQIVSLQNSLGTIKNAHSQLGRLTSSSITPKALASQIDLCNVLLDEISGIRSNLAKHVEDRRMALPRVKKGAGLNS